MKADDVACDWFVVILWLEEEVEEGSELLTSSSSVILKASGYNPVNYQFLKHRKSVHVCTRSLIKFSLCFSFCRVDDGQIGTWN